MTAATIATYTTRQLDYWTRIGVVKADARPKTGIGYPRTWSAGELRVADLIGRLRRSGIELFAAARAARTLATGGSAEIVPGLLLSMDHPVRTWSLELPAGLLLLNANQRLHWAEKADRTAMLRKAGFTVARAAKVPPLERGEVTVEYQPPQVLRKRDAGNWAPTGKPLIDGLRDARVFADDDSGHVLTEAYRIGDPHPGGRIVLHIQEVTG